MKKIIYLSITALWLSASIFLFPMRNFAQRSAVKQAIFDISQLTKGNVGVAFINLEDGDTLYVNGNGHYPMQSVFKFPLAMTVLNQVDKGKLSLDQKIYVAKADLMPDTHSPLRDTYPSGNMHIALRELLSYAVSKSDNNACDILFRLLGGAKNVDAYIHSLDVQQIAIAATEAEMHEGWNIQYANWCEPKAMLALLKIFYERKHLSKVSSDFLWKIMTETATGPNRIKGLLPRGTVVAHKTGTSNTNEKGITAATNDAGIVVLPDGKHFGVVVFVSDSPESEKIRESVIAKITKVLWNYMTERKI